MYPNAINAATSILNAAGVRGLFTVRQADGGGRMDRAAVARQELQAPVRTPSAHQLHCSALLHKGVACHVLC